MASLYAAEPLAPDLCRAVDALFGAGRVAGNRYAPAILAEVDTEEF